jgi:hypothetical protein
MNATLAQLLFVQSRLAEDTADFLLSVANVIDWTPWEFVGKELRASSAFIEPIVFTEREIDRDHDRDDRKEPKEHEEVSGSGIDPIDALLLKQYERERHVGKHEERRWNQVIRPGGNLRAVVTGEPGGGKTCATRYAVAEMARRSADSLRMHLSDVSEVALPFWVTATHLLSRICLSSRNAAT